MGVLHLGL
uniref:Uncharacterized protein n=1 Tax=Arundo donax TaxID=35708 RepID=A0A0A8Z0X4_ARUDO